MSMMPIDPMSPFPVGPRGLQFDLPNPAKKGGMFGNADWGSAISAAMNGFLAAGGNQAGTMGLEQMYKMRQLKQQQQLEAQTYQHHRQDDNTDWQAHQDYQLAHQAPSDFEQAAQAGGYAPGTPEWADLMKRKTDNAVDPVVMTPYGPMVRSQALQMGGGQPAPPHVTFTPIDPTKGGPTQPASGGFLGS